MRNVLLVVAGALVAGLVFAIVERSVLRPRREADALVAAARPFASSSSEVQWFAAESLLAQAELRQKGRRDVADLRATITAKRTEARALDDALVTRSLHDCLANVEKQGPSTEASGIRADEAKHAPPRELHARCKMIELRQLLSGHPAASESAP